MRILLRAKIEAQKGFRLDIRQCGELASQLIGLGYSARICREKRNPKSSAVTYSVEYWTGPESSGQEAED